MYLILSILLIFAASATGASNPAQRACRSQHTQNQAQCSKVTDVSQDRSISTTTHSYLYEDCKRASVITVFLDRFTRTNEHPSYLSCTSTVIEKGGGTVTRIITDMGTTLTVDVRDGEVRTTVTTKDGEVACKTSMSDSINAEMNTPVDSYWCGVMIRPARAYTELKPPLLTQELTPVFYAKKSLSDLLQERELLQNLEKPSIAQ